MIKNRKVLFVHANFPGQFLYLSQYLKFQQGCQVVFITANQETSLDGVNKVVYDVPREVKETVHPLVKKVERAVLQGQSVYRKALALREQGFYPDVVLAHSGWGQGMFIKDVFPKAACIGYFEWFSREKGADLGFFPDVPLNLAQRCDIQMSNTPLLVDLSSSDCGVSPTFWQRSQFPVEFQSKISVIHDGIDVEKYKPMPGAPLVLPDIGLDLSESAELITYVSRGLEPYRGFPQFMEAVSQVLRNRPQCHVVIVGEDRQAYGGPSPEPGKTHKTMALENLELDMNRVHFTGPLMRKDYLRVLQASTVHVYLTCPFVLSWSAMEAMSTGCAIVASRTPPVEEVMRDGENAVLVDFFASDQIARQIENLLDTQELRAKLAKGARQTILAGYALPDMLQRYRELFDFALENR